MWKSRTDLFPNSKLSLSSKRIDSVKIIYVHEHLVSRESQMDFRWTRVFLSFWYTNIWKILWIHKREYLEDNRSVGFHAYTLKIIKIHQEHIRPAFLMSTDSHPKEWCSINHLSLQGKKSFSGLDERLDESLDKWLDEWTISINRWMNRWMTILMTI